MSFLQAEICWAPCSIPDQACNRIHCLYNIQFKRFSSGIGGIGTSNLVPLIIGARGFQKSSKVYWTGLVQYGSYPLEMYGSRVWIEADRLWVQGIDRGLPFWAAAIWLLQKDSMVSSSSSPTRPHGFPGHGGIFGREIHGNPYYYLAGKVRAN